MLAPTRPCGTRRRIEVEHRCDSLTHSIIQRLNQDVRHPLDREDITPGPSLDDVMDAIDAAASRIRIYKLDRVRFGGRELAKIITASAIQVRAAMQTLEQKKGLVVDHAIEINRLENEADRCHQEAVMRLFDEEHDPILVMKWKEALDFLEEATDRCEDVANVLEGVVVKYG